MPVVQMDWSISFGALINALSVLAGGVGVVVSMRTQIGGILVRLSRVEVTQEKQTDILLRLAVQETRLNGIEARLSELAHQRAGER